MLKIVIFDGDKKVLERNAKVILATLQETDFDKENKENDKYAEGSFVIYGSITMTILRTAEQYIQKTMADFAVRSLAKAFGIEPPPDDTLGGQKGERL